MTKFNSKSPLPVFKFAIPTILMGLSQTLMTSIDYIFTNKLGAEVAAAIAPAATICFVPISFWLGLMSIYSTLPAASFVKDDKKSLTSYLLVGLAICLLALPVSFALSFFAPQLISFFGHDSTVQFYEVQYLQALALTIPGAALAFLCQNFFTLLGNTRTPSLVVIGGHGINVLLNYILVYGVFGQPMGLSGAAIATVVATFFQALAMLAILLYKYRHIFLQNKPDQSLISAIFKQVMKVSLPSGFQWMQSSLAWMLFTNLVIGQLAVIEMASHNILNQVAKLATLPIIGLANSTTSLMAQSVGQSDYESFFKVSHHMRNIALAMISIISLFLLVFAESVFSVLTKDGAVIDQLQQMLPILLIYIWVAAFETMNSTKLRANNDTLSSAIITTASLWVILIAGSYLSLNAWPSMGVKGPWMCTIVSSLFTLACFRYRFSTLSLAKAN